MNSADQVKLDAAIASHLQWMGRLRSAIETGTSDFLPDGVQVDNRCEFGKWLHGSFPASLKQTPEYEAVRKLHAEFHEEAAAILRLALAGKKTDATVALLSSGKFNSLSGSIVLKLRGLRQR